MSTLETSVASLPGVSLSLGQLLQTLHAQGRLRPLVAEALAGRLVQQEARQAGLSVPVEDLQAVVDTFRRARGLHTATATRTWLDGQGLTVGDFEAGLEERLLAVKLKHHQTAAQADESFAAHRTDFEQLRVARVVTDRDDLARELTSQVRDEGRDLEGVAREHGLPVTRRRLFRRDLPGHLAEALATAQPGELVGPARRHSQPLGRVHAPAQGAVALARRQGAPRCDPARVALIGPRSFRSEPCRFTLSSSFCACVP
jgi:hypothetical protein